MAVTGDAPTCEIVDLSTSKSLAVPAVADYLAQKYAVAGFVAGKVVACGGIRNLFSAEFDFQQNTWTETAKLPTARAQALSFLSNDGDTLYILGGEERGGQPLNSALKYHNGAINGTLTIPYTFVRACGVTVNSTHRLLAGGDSAGAWTNLAYLLEISTWQWTKIPGMLKAR